MNLNKRNIRLYAFFLLFFVIHPINILGDNNAFILNNNLHKVQLAKYLEYLKDDSSLLNINDVISDNNKTKFIKSKKDKISLGYSNASFWFKLKVKNNKKSDIKWNLEYGYPLVDYISIYIPEKNDFKVIETGDRLKFSTRPIDCRTFIFPLTTPPGETTYYLKIKSQGSLSIELKAWSKEKLLNRIKIETPLQWIYTGILLALFFYSIFIFFSTKEKAYLYLSLFLFGISMFNLINNGLAYQYLWSNSPFMGNVLHPVILSFTNVFALLFTATFLNTKEYNPVTYKVLQGLIIIITLFIMFPFFISYYYSTQVTVILAGISGTIMIFIGIKSLILKIRAAIFYMISWIFFITGTMMLVLKVYGILTDSFITSWGMQIGSASTALLLSLGVADKINTMRDEKEKAEVKILHQYEEIQGQYEELEALNEELQSTHFELIEANILIKQEKEQLFATLSSIEEGIISYNEKGDILLLNKIAEKFINFIKDTDTKQSILKSINLLDEKKNIPLTINQKKNLLLGKGNDKNNIYLIRNNKDNIRTVEIKRTAIQNDDLIGGGIVLAIKDITEQQKLEKELFKLNKIESLGVLAGGIAHDLNNLLTAIVGNVSIAKTLASDGSEISLVLDKIEQACKMTTNFTNQLLTFSKGGSPVKKTSSLVDLIKENAYFVLSGSDIKCDINLINTIPPVNIDAEQISQVFYNLIINAKQASGKKSCITITIDITKQIKSNIPLNAGEYIIITISDEGTGIKEEIIEQIFDPYFTTKNTGSGLGLASSFSIMKKHGGHIEVESEMKVGTKFTLYFPITKDKIIKEEEKYKTFQKKQGKVLILDDNQTILDVAKKLFSILGYNVDTASTGEEAYDKYNDLLKTKNSYSFIIMDLTIPGGMGGKETLDKIIKIDPEVFAVVSSGYSDDDIMSNYKVNGFKGALLKPYNIEDVKKLIQEMEL